MNTGGRRFFIEEENDTHTSEGACAFPTYGPETNDKPGRRARKAAGMQIKQERFLTVSLYPGTMPRMPWIRLRGLWLVQAGFTPQSRVRVRVMRGCLVITTE